MTVLLLPAVTETKITLPSGAPVNIASWFHPRAGWHIKPASIQGWLYLCLIGGLTLLPVTGLILNLAADDFTPLDLIAIPLGVLGVMMYIHALRQTSEREQ